MKGDDKADIEAKIAALCEMIRYRWRSKMYADSHSRCAEQVRTPRLETRVRHDDVVDAEFEEVKERTSKQQACAALGSVAARE